MRNKHIDPIKSTLVRRTKLFSFYLLAALLLIISFSPKAAWAAAPPAPTNLTATAASSKQINLSWQDNATNEANYYVERALASKGPWKVIAALGANVISYQNTGLTQNTTYYYQVRCKAGNTYSSYSNTANAMTAALAAPTGLTAAVISASSISLAWTDNTNYETNYSVERSPNGSKSWTVIATLGANVITYTNTGLTVGTAYYYRVRAYDGTNYSAFSAVVSLTIRTIISSAGVNGAISPIGTVSVRSGATVTFTITPNTEYHVADVLVDGASVGAVSYYTFTNMTANHTIIASFEINPYTITAKANANGTIEPTGAVRFNLGATATYTMTPNTGCHISDVLVDGASVGAVGMYTFTNVTADHTITVSFAINTYTITASADANRQGAISPSGVVSVNSGATKVFSMTPITGSLISDVLVDGASLGAVSTYTFTNITTDHTISASFTVSIENDDTNIYCQGTGTNLIGPSNFTNGISVPPVGTNAVLIASPSNGSTINGSKTIIKGAMDTTVPVNGVIVQVINASGTVSFPAEVNGKYFAAQVQLTADSNTIKVIATDQNNVQHQATVTVTVIIQPDNVTLLASPKTGIPTLKPTGQTTLDVAITATATFPAMSYAWDFNSSGANQLTCYSHSNVMASYQQTGLYLTQVTVTDTVGNSFPPYTVIVNVLDIASTDAHFKQKWNGIKDKLSSQDVEGALSYIINNGAQAKYRIVFQQLLPQLPTIAANMKDVTLDYVNSDVAEYRISRTENVNGQMTEITYFIYFRKDENGVWQLESF